MPFYFSSGSIYFSILGRTKRGFCPIQKSLRTAGVILHVVLVKQCVKYIS